MADLIQKTDTLNDGREKLNEAIKDADTAKVDASTAKSTANQALAKSTDTQTQLDTIVIEGDSSVEAAQARVDAKGNPHTTLKARLDAEQSEVTSQLAENLNVLNVLLMPAIIVTKSEDLQSAINTLNGGGKIIFAPDTVFDIKSVVVDKNNIHFTGLGATIKPKSDGKLFSLANGVKNIKFTELLFDLGNTYVNGDSFAIYGENNSDITVDKCEFSGGGNGVGLKNVVNLKLSNCVGHHANFWPFVVWGCDGLTYENNRSYNNKYDGLKLAGNMTSEARNNTKNVLIKGNECFGNERDGLDIAINDGENIIICDNNFHNNRLLGIECKSVYQGILVKNIQIYNNLIVDNSLGISLESQAGGVGAFLKDISVHDNRVVGLSNVQSLDGVTGIYLHQFGIKLGKIETASVKKNTIVKYENGARLMQGCNNVIVEDNIFKQNRNGVRLDGDVVDKTKENKILKNQFRAETDTQYAIRVADVNCENNVIKDNNFDPNGLIRAFMQDLGTNTIKHNNIVGYLSAIPARIGTIGEVVINTNPRPGQYERWVVIVEGNPATFKGVGLIAE